MNLVKVNYQIFSSDICYCEMISLYVFGQSAISKRIRNLAVELCFLFFSKFASHITSVLRSVFDSCGLGNFLSICSMLKHLSSDLVYLTHHPIFVVLTLLHSERPKLFTIWAFLSAVGFNQIRKKKKKSMWLKHNDEFIGEKEMKLCS